MGSSSPSRVEHQKYLKPPPSVVPYFPEHMKDLKVQKRALGLFNSERVCLNLPSMRLMMLVMC